MENWFSGFMYLELRLQARLLTLNKLDHTFISINILEVAPRKFAELTRLRFPWQHGRLEN